MSITKCNLNANYSKLPNGLSLDKSISLQSLKIMVYLWSLPDGWIVNNTDVCNKLGLRDRVIYKYWRELINSGWITRYQAKTKGKFGNFEYHLNEFPVKDVIEITTPENRHTETQHTVETVYGEMGVLTNTHSCTNTHSTSKTHVNNEKNTQKREIEIKEVIDYFNKKTNSNFKNASKTIDNLKLILDKHTVDEVKLVIDYISQDDWHIRLNRVVLPVICRPTLFAEKLAIAISHKNNPNKPRKFNDVDEFPEDNPVEVDYATLVEEEKNKILWSDINDN